MNANSLRADSRRARVFSEPCPQTLRGLNFLSLGAKMARRIALTCLVVFVGLLVVADRPVAAAVFSGVETPFVVKPGIQTDPHVSGRYTVFTDLSVRSADVWYHDAADGSLHLVAGGEGDQLLADVSGSLIVYTDRATSAGDIHLYDIATGVDTNLTNDPSDQSNPTVSSRLAAWEDFGDVDGNIVVYDRATATTTVIGGAGDQHAPAASEARVAYLDEAAVKVYDADTGITSLVYPGPAQDAAIDGTHVALTLFSITDADIAVYDVAGNLLARLTLPGDQSSPHISGDWVAFEDFSSGTKAHVGLWHWTGGEVYFPTPSTSRQQLNSISGHRVVYTDDRSGDLDIYAFDFTFTADVSDQIGQLTALVQSFNLKQGITNSLDVKLQNVQAALAATKAGDTITACNLMGAFINEVQAQSGKAITVQQAAQLIQAANDIRASLGCP